MPELLMSANEHKVVWSPCSRDKTRRCARRAWVLGLTIFYFINCRLSLYRI